MDLSDANTFINSVEELDRQGWRSTATEAAEAEAWYNLWGWFEKMDKKKSDSERGVSGIAGILT